jgi:hypothetical protein
MSDICERLRSEVVWEPEAGELMAQAADEIARLRLTDEERGAVEAAIAYMAPVGNYDSRVQDTLRGLLERCACDSDRSQPIATPGPPCTPAECTMPPEWMSRPYWVDPPSGHRYGFPRLYDPSQDGDMTQWMVANGYPQHLADQHLPCTFTACTDSQ